MIYISYRPLGTDLFKPGRLCKTVECGRSFEEEPVLENPKTLKNGETNTREKVKIILQK